MNVGIIGCSGSRFKEIYLPFFIEKKRENRINFIKVFNRTKEAADNVSKILQSGVAEDIDDIIYDENIDLIFLIVTEKVRKLILKKNLRHKKTFVTEVPAIKNIIEYHILRRNLKTQNINLFIFEDRYYLYKKIFKEFLHNNITNIILQNIEWMHHAYGAFAALNIKKKLDRVKYIKNRNSDEFIFTYTNFKFHYIFENNKKNNVRESGKIFLKNDNNLNLEFSFSKKDYAFLKNRSINSFFDDNENNFKNLKEDNYLTCHLKGEAIFVTTIKIFKLIKIEWFAKFIIFLLIKLHILR
jgi:hypothetical protein